MISFSSIYRVRGKQLKTFTKLAYESHGSDMAGRTIIFLHGILGQKRNWRTPSKQLVLQNPDVKCISVDLRGHGESKTYVGENNLESCAIDLEKLIADLNIDAKNTILIGHSFGGKVALTYLLKQRAKNKLPPRYIWILDSLPFKYDTTLNDSDGQSVKGVFDLLLTLPKVFSSREQCLERIINAGVPKATAQWLLTNLEPSQTISASYEFSFNLDTLLKLFTNFCSTDLWPKLEEISRCSNGSTADESYEVHFVRAGKNKLWTPEVLSLFAGLRARDQRFYLHNLTNAGHWVHVDDLPGLLTLIQTYSLTQSSSKSSV